MFLTHDSGLTRRPIITQSPLTNENKAGNTGYAKFQIASFNKELIRPSKKKKTHVPRPRPLHFLAPPLFFYYFYEQRFYEQKSTGVTCKN